jgi:hypothetical protein
MATVRWTGLATAVAQVDTFTPEATPESGDTFTLTSTGWDGVVSALTVTGCTTAAEVVTAMKAAIAASTSTAWSGITTSGTATLILTASTAGVAFSVAATCSAGTTFSRAATTASAGPLHWDSAANWSGNAVPVNDDDIFIDNWTGNILYGLNQDGITADSLNIAKSFTGQIGVAGAAGKIGTYLQIEPDKVEIGYNYGTATPAGSGLLMIDTKDTASTITVYDTGTPSGTGKYAVLLLAAAAGTTINVKKGKVGIAAEAGETSTVGTINISYVSGKTSDATVYIGKGVTLTTLTKTGGIATLNCAATTINHNGGTLAIAGSGAITTLNVGDGTVNNYCTGTITTLSVYGSGYYNRLAVATITNLPVNVRIQST